MSIGSSCHCQAPPTGVPWRTLSGIDVSRCGMPVGDSASRGTYHVEKSVGAQTPCFQVAYAVL